MIYYGAIAVLAVVLCSLALLFYRLRRINCGQTNTKDREGRKEDGKGTKDAGKDG
jgi:hypothetical protein